MYLEKYNTKLLIYPDGRELYICANRQIFGKSEKEESLEEVPFVPDYFDSSLYADQIEGRPSLQNEALNKERALLRSKSRVFNIAYCNVKIWTHFLTITFNDKLIDGSDIFAIGPKLIRWLDNMSRRKGLKYLLVPEFHRKGGRIHCHALINGIFDMVDSGTRIIEGTRRPMKLETIRKKGLEHKIRHVVYNVPEWKYGFSTAIPIYGSPAQLAAYVTKYLTKGCDKIFGKYYWSSRDLIREPETFYFNAPYDEFDEASYHIPNTSIECKYISGEVYSAYTEQVNIEPLKLLPWE